MTSLMGRPEEGRLILIVDDRTGIGRLQDDLMKSVLAGK